MCGLCLENSDEAVRSRGVLDAIQFDYPPESRIFDAIPRTVAGSLGRPTTQVLTHVSSTISPRGDR